MLGSALIVGNILGCAEGITDEVGYMDGRNDGEVDGTLLGADDSVGEDEG